MKCLSLQERKNPLVMFKRMPAMEPKGPSSPNRCLSGANRHRSIEHGTIESLRNGIFAMPLQQGDVGVTTSIGPVVEFTMLNNRSNVILCAISTAAMDHLEGRRDVRPDQRIDQFMRLREVIEERASR